MALRKFQFCRHRGTAWPTVICLLLTFDRAASAVLT